MQLDAGPKPGLGVKKHGGAGMRIYGARAVAAGLGGEAFGDERLFRCWLLDVRFLRGSSFLDLIEQPCLDRGCRAVSFRIVMGKAARFEDDGTQFGGAAAARVVEVD